MSTLSLNDKIETLQCPNCGKYISSDAAACRFCSIPITAEMMQAGVEKETEEIRKFQIDFYKTTLASGAITLFIGGGLLFFSIVSVLFLPEGRFFLWSPVITLLGIGQIIYSLNGFYKERRRKKKP